MNELRMGFKQAILQRIQNFESSTSFSKSTESSHLPSRKRTASVSPTMQPAQITDFSINRILGDVPKASSTCNKKSTIISEVIQHGATPKCATTTNDNILDLSKNSTEDLDPAAAAQYSATYAAFHHDFLAAAAAANATKLYAQFFPHIFPAAYPYPVTSKRYFAPYVLNTTARAPYRYPAIPTAVAAASGTNLTTPPATDILRPKPCTRDCTDCVVYYNQFPAKTPLSYGTVVTSDASGSPYLKTKSAAELLLISSATNSMISPKSIRSISGKISKVHSQGGDSPSASPLSDVLNSEEISYKCRICDKVFGCSQTLQAHERTHKSPRYECTDCGKGFSQLRNYKYHLSVHRGTKEFAAECPECGKTFNDKGYLSSHMKIHRNKKEYECPYCPKSFNQRVAFNMHVRIHTGVKPHKCVECGKRFSRKMLLKQHMRTHSGEKPYQCSVCGKSFADRSNMTLHHRLHSGIKPFNCPICPKAFTKKHHLKTHLNYHTGCKPYVCPHPNCNQAFTQSSNMRTHAKKCQYRPLQLVFPASTSTMDSKTQSTVTTATAAAATTTSAMAIAAAAATNNFTALRLPHTSTASPLTSSSTLSAGIRMFASTSFNAVQTQLPPAQQQLMASLRPF